MATRAFLHPYAAEPPESGTFPEIVTVNGRPALAFDASADETARWTLRVPQGWTGTLTAIVDYAMASATSGSVRGQAQIEAISDGDAVDLDAATSFDTANSAGATVPATAGHLDQLSITLTNNDSSAAGDYARLSFNRDADGTSGTDDAAGDMYVFGIEIRDSA